MRTVSDVQKSDITTARPFSQTARASPSLPFFDIAAAVKGRKPVAPSRARPVSNPHSPAYYANPVNIN